MKLSIVVPCMNEEGSVPVLIDRLSKATETWADDCEIILVDDGSTDRTWEVIREAHKGTPAVRGIRLSANRGHQAALTAGLEAARGERVFMLDADLQDPPELLDDMMAIMDMGYDVVYGRRIARNGETFFKKASAFVFYRTLNLLSDVEIPNDTGDFRLVSRRALDAVLNMPERSRFIRGMFSWVGFRQIGIEYVRNERILGETKYPLRAMLRFAIDAVTGFSTRPLRFATRLSFLSLAVTFVMVFYTIASFVFFQSAPGWASMLIAISFFSGIQLLAIGIIGEYLGRLYIEAKARPLYHKAEEIGEDPEEIEGVAQWIKTK